MAINNEIVYNLLKGADPKKVFSSEGLMVEIKKALAKRKINDEINHHLDGEAATAEANGETQWFTVILFSPLLKTLPFEPFSSRSLSPPLPTSDSA